MSEDPADLVLASITAGRGEPVRREASARIAIWIIARLVPELRKASHPRIGRDPDVPCETVGAVQVTTEHAEGDRVGAGEGMKEGLLLDRVALQGANVATRDHQRAAAVVANFADAPKPLLDQAAVSARIAANLVVRQLFIERPERAFLDPPVERQRERCRLFGGHRPEYTTGRTQA